MKLQSIVVFLLVAEVLCAQDAAQPNVDLGPSPTESPSPAKSPPAEVPELGQLDEAFKQTSLGKAADAYRTRIEMRRLQNEVENDPGVLEAKKAANAARTDLERREWLRAYYNVYYGRMRSRASSEETKKAIDEAKDEHLKLVAQPRVRPNPNEPIPEVTPEKKKKQKKSKFGLGN
jgi:hypothetical protein